MKNNVMLIYSWLVRSSLFLFPAMPILLCFREFPYSFGMSHCSKNFQVTNNAILKGLQHLGVGNNVIIRNYSIFHASDNIKIENDVLIGPHVVNVSGNHTLLNNSYRYGKGKKGLIKIEDECWIAANCTIGLNSFINKKFENQNASSSYGCIPAKFIKYA